VESLQAGHKIKNLGFRRVATGVIVLGRFDDEVDYSRKTAATAATFCHGMVDFCRDNKLPTVLVQQLIDDVADVVVGNVIAAANQHD